MVQVNPELEIPDDELGYRFSRSSGPGGQNVNKVETRVTLLFPVATSPSLDEAQRQRVTEALATRISKDGMLRVTSQRHRSREANRLAALERFTELMRAALAEETPRKPTRTPPRARRRRLQSKRRRGEVKRLRSKPEPE